MGQYMKDFLSIVSFFNILRENDPSYGLHTPSLFTARLGFSIQAKWEIILTRIIDNVVWWDK